MAFLKPFKALRPAPDVCHQVASVPYDVVNTEEARVLAKGNPLSFLHVVRPEIDFPEGHDPYAPDVYEKAAANLRGLIDSGRLRYDKTESYYLYAQKMGGHVQTGLVGLASVDDYDADVIKKHETTRPNKEADRTRHVLALRANAGPVFLTYRQRPEIDAMITKITAAPPVNRFTAVDGIEHTVWPVTDPAGTGALTRAFSAVPAFYVADGHHRSASAAAARAALSRENKGHTGREPYNYFLCVLFPDNQLNILPYNRVVKDLNGLDPAGFLKKACEKFDITAGGDKSPNTPGRISLYLAGQWHSLAPRPGVAPASDPVRSLDVSVLQDNLLSPVLGIDDPRTSKRIDFVGGIRGTAELEKLVDSGRYQAAFSMFPTTVAQLMAIADSGRIMPPKSTWFEPKLRSGLIVHAFGSQAG
jgi:uncharacterized protein (DUF1015 family)